MCFDFFLFIITKLNIFIHALLISYRLTQKYSQKPNDLTGEFSTIMISVLKNDKVESANWLSMYYRDFRRRIIKLLGKSFQSFTTALALSLLDNKAVAIENNRKYSKQTSATKLIIIMQRFCENHQFFFLFSSDLQPYHNKSSIAPSFRMIYSA